MRPALLLAALLSLLRPAAADPLTEAWNLAARLDFSAAKDRFEKLVENGGADPRAARFGLAMSLFSAPPITSASVTRAEALLRAVRAEAPDDDLGLQAAFFLARSAHVHRSPRDFAAAYRGFVALAAHAPAHRAGQLALVEAAMIDLYRPQEERTAAERLAHWVAECSGLADPATRRSAFTVLGDAAVRLTKDADLASRLYAEAADLKFARPDYQSMILFRVAIFAERAGKHDLALAYLQRWRRDYASRGYGPVVDLWEDRLRKERGTAAGQP